MDRPFSPHTEPEKEQPTAAILSVAVPAPLLEQLTDQVDHMPWRTSHEDFSEYFSAQSRPRWTPATKAAKICIALVDFDGNTQAALDTIEFLLQSLPGRVSVIALTSDPDPSIILRAMRAGCSEYLPKPLDNRSLTDALERIERRMATIQENAVILGNVICFLGSKGGVGTTTLATHLGIHLAVTHKKKTLLIDNDPGLGHVCLYLGLGGSHYSFRDLLRNVNRLDSELLKGFVLHHATGLDVIASAELYGTPIEAEPDDVRRTLNFIREQYEYVVVDCSTLLEDSTMAIVDMAELVYLVATPDIGAVRDLSRLIDGLLRFQQPQDKLRVVLNRAGSKGAMAVPQIEKAARLPVARKINNSYLELARAANLGVPVMPEEKSDFSAELREWSGEIVGSEAESAALPVAKRKGFWR